MHLRALRGFVAVAEHLSFTRAAAALFVSQPALSQQVAGLERHLRVQLLARDRRGVRLTPAGEALLPGAAAVLRSWETAQDEMARAVDAARSTLVVGVHLGVERGLLPDVRARLSATSPGTDLRVRQVSWSDPTGGLGGDLGGEVDAAFVWLPLPQEERFRWVPVVHEPRRLLVSASHALATRTTVTLAELADERFLALPAEVGPLRETLLATDERGARPVRVGAEVASTEETVEALAAGLGICLVAAGNVRTFLREGVAVLDVVGLSGLDLVLAWRRDDTRPALGVLVDAVRAAAGAGGREDRRE